MSEATVRVMTLLDELEELFEESSKMPFSEKGLVDVDTAKSIIKDIRLSLPKDLEEAEWLRQEKERILDDAKKEYNKVIMSARDQAEYLVENDVIKKEAEKRAHVLETEARKRSKYMQLRTCEFVDKKLYDMQTEIADIANAIIQPLNTQLSDMVNGVNMQINENRQQMRDLAEKIQMSDDDEVGIDE